MNLDYRDITIVLFVITVAISGYVINFTRKKAKVPIALLPQDSSVWVFRFVVPASLILSVVFYYSEFGSFYLKYGVGIGYFFVVFGLLLRWYAVYSLGSSFQVKISLIENQKLKKEGVYRLLRHPSYSGLLLYYTGFGLLLQNYWSIVILLAGNIFTVLNRIKKEEAFLLDAFGDEYKSYQSKSKKLIPYIY